MTRHLVVTMVINLLVPAVQTTGHIIAGSVTLRSEALHNLIDFALKLISHVTILLGE
jgi:divalent metal cation (Fe/Co/Zn/Cd) transporter